ncbi:MAG: hypothetical protein KY394_00855 [Actinobacteria bacterium]|nr:hypothetical protein [Actinomycetota bacterium]
MELSQSQVEEIEGALARLEEVDPADLPEPAADLADILSRLLDGMESN